MSVRAAVIVPALTEAEIQQLLAYLEDRDRTGWFYGSRQYFEARHTALKTKLMTALEQAHGDKKKNSGKARA